jgi:hypothetical protein
MVMMIAPLKNPVIAAEPGAEEGGVPEPSDESGGIAAESVPEAVAEPAGQSAPAPSEPPTPQPAEAKATAS